MKKMDRRELGLALSAFARLGSISAEAQPSEGPALAHSEIFAFDKLPINTGNNGMVARAVIRGTLATGE
jgi:hypothetical protein